MERNVFTLHIGDILQVVLILYDVPSLIRYVENFARPFLGDRS